MLIIFWHYLLYQELRQLNIDERKLRQVWKCRLRLFQSDKNLISVLKVVRSIPGGGFFLENIFFQKNYITRKVSFYFLLLSKHFFQKQDKSKVKFLFFYWLSWKYARPSARPPTRTIRAPCSILGKINRRSK